MKSGPDQRFQRIQSPNINFGDKSSASPVCNIEKYALYMVFNLESLESILYHRILDPYTCSGPPIQLMHYECIFVDSSKQDRRVKIPSNIIVDSIKAVNNRHFICLDDKYSVQEYKLEESTSGNLDCMHVKTILPPLSPPSGSLFSPPDNRFILSASPNGEHVLIRESIGRDTAFCLYSQSTKTPLPTSRYAENLRAYQFVSDSSFLRYTTMKKTESAIEVWRIHHNKPIKIGQYVVPFRQNEYPEIDEVACLKLSMKGESLLVSYRKKDSSPSTPSILVSLNELSKNPRSDNTITRIDHGPFIPCWVVENSQDKVVLLDTNMEVKLIDFNNSPRKEHVFEQAHAHNSENHFFTDSQTPSQVTILTSNGDGTVTPEIFRFSDSKLTQEIKDNVTTATPLIPVLSSLVADYTGTDIHRTLELTLEREKNLLKQEINLVMQDSSLSGANRAVLTELQSGIENTFTVSDLAFYQHVLTDPRFQDNRLDERVLAIIDHAQILARQLLPQERPAPGV